MSQYSAQHYKTLTCSCITIATIVPSGMQAKSNYKWATKPGVCYVTKLSVAGK